MTKLVNRAKMTTATTGTGTITLGSAVTGYQTFADAGVVNADVVRYVIEDGNNWEIGTGTYTASGTTLSRTPSESSNADSAIDLSGNAVVYVTAAAADIGSVTSVNLTAGTGISVSGGPITESGSITVTNTAPDQTVVLTQGSNVTITGTYPNFTISSTDTNTTYTAGTGLGLAGTVFSIDSTVATLTGSQTLTNKTLTDPAIIGTILEDVFTITDGAAFEIDPGNGSVQLITLGASRTPKATNFAAGEAITLMVDDGSAFTITWTDATFGGSGVIWKTDGGVAPTLNTTGYTVIVLWKVGTQVYGARVGDA